MTGASASLGPNAVPQLGHVSDGQPWWYQKYGQQSLMQQDGTNWWYNKYGPHHQARARGRTLPPKWMLAANAHPKQALRETKMMQAVQDGNTPQERLRHWYERNVVGMRE